MTRNVQKRIIHILTWPTHPLNLDELSSTTQKIIIIFFKVKCNNSGKLFKVWINVTIWAGWNYS